MFFTYSHLFGCLAWSSYLSCHNCPSVHNCDCYCTSIYFAWFHNFARSCIIYVSPVSFLTSLLPVSCSLFCGITTTFICALASLVVPPPSCLLAYVDRSFLSGSNERIGGRNNTDTWQFFFFSVFINASSAD